MQASRLVAPALALTLFTQSQSTPHLGASLAPGLQLLYESNGVTTPWFIDSVNSSFAAGSRSDCLRIVLRIGTGAAQVRTHCVVGDTMMNWSQSAGRLAPARRLSAGALTIPAANRGSNRFDVKSAESVTVDGQQFVVLPTVMTTFDSSGKAIRRLRERFAPTLATATDGTFEVPDSAQTGQWRVTQQFRLTGIKRP